MGSAVEEDCDTDPRQVRVQQPRPAPADVWRRDPFDSWRSLLAEPPVARPVGFAHNGPRIDDGRRVRPTIAFQPRSFEPGPRGDRRTPPPASVRHDDVPPRNRHYRPDPDEPADGGRHSSGT
jgi:hypothetical protein